MFSPAMMALAQSLLAEARTQGLHIATAESCTGGLIAALLTEIPGSSDVLDRGFVTYSNEAKAELLGVAASTLDVHGAVSEPVAREMAEGALRRSQAHLAVAVTGIAGPAGGSKDKPVGLVHLAAARRGGETLHEVRHFGDIGRSAVRMKTVEAALLLLRRLL